jgi:hypothetical protein
VGKQKNQPTVKQLIGFKSVPERTIVALFKRRFDELFALK